MARVLSVLIVSSSLVLGSACSSGSDVVHIVEDPSESVSSDSSKVDLTKQAHRPSAGKGATAAAADFVKPATRCSECHGQVYEDWKGSAHARAASSNGYGAMKHAAPEGERAACDRCHSPFRGVITGRSAAIQERIFQEGVNCDGCHMIAKTESDGEGRISLDYRVRNNVKYGALCDTKDHYFHRVECSEAFQESELCGGCHQYARELADGSTLPVLTEYSDWESGPSGDLGLPCQSCHMSDYAGEIAVGQGVRSDVKQHRFISRGAGLRQRALSLELSASWVGGQVVVVGHVSNVDAGHYVPSGLPARRVELRVSLIGHDGSEGPHTTIEYGRVLVDKEGHVAPFISAVRLARDTRIAPKEKRAVRLSIAAQSPAHRVRATLVWIAMAEPVARRIGLDERDEEIMTQVEVELDAGPKARNKTRPVGTR